MAMSDGRFVSVAIAIAEAREGELPTENWQIGVCMLDEQLRVLAHQERSEVTRAKRRCLHT